VIKLFAFLRRRAELTHAEFCSGWLDVHAEAVKDTPAFSRHVRRYVQNHALADVDISGLPTAHFDGAAELWFETLGDLTEALGEPSFGEVIAPSIGRFADRKSTIMVAAEEAVQFDRGFGEVKFIGLSRRAPAFTHDEWVRYWIEVHGPMAHGIPEFTRYYGKYVHNYVVPTGLDSIASTDEYDGVVEESVRSVEEFARCLREPRYLEIVRPDELKFVDVARSHFLLAREHAIIG